MCVRDAKSLLLSRLAEVCPVSACSGTMRVRCNVPLSTTTGN